MAAPLQPPDSFRLSAAVGWIELGNLAEARAELDGIGAEHQSHPDVLEVRWLLCAAQKDWAGALQVAEQLVQTVPDRVTGWLHRAYAARRAPGGSVQTAWDLLLPAAPLFPKEPIIPFNLACYACQMNQPDEAIKWLHLAMHIGTKDRIKAMALADEDLRPLWPRIAKL